jgi:hypothetical protein
MKNLLIPALGLIIPNLLFSQTSYPLYSDVWRFSSSNVFEVGEVSILPKKEDFFKLTSSYYIKNVDTNLVKKYLLTSFNEFRKDYGKPPVVENQKLTKSATEYSILMSDVPSDEWEHTDITKNEFYLSGNYVAEVMAGIDNMTLNNLDPSYGNLNKIIADCIFDIFIASQKHSDILLKNTPNYEVGFGVTFTDWGIMIVIQLTE